MRQVLHLLIVDRDRGAALAAAYGSRWLLPALNSPERARIDSFVAAWTAERGIDGNILGQWLGRVTQAGASMDWLVAISTGPGSCASPNGLVWTPLAALRSSPSVLEYQQWAIETVLKADGMPSVSGPFGNLTWLDEVKGWIAGTVDHWNSSSVTPYRVTAYEVVLGVRTCRTSVFFKGLAPDRAAEARLTQTLSSSAPETFARTIALLERPDGSVWWLAAECPGRTVARCAPEEVTSHVARALARAQQRLMAVAARLRELREIDFAAAVDWASNLLDDSTSRAAIARACDHVQRASLPRSWIPMDLDPGNVLVDDGGGVRFIDLDDSFLGPAPLAITVFARRCRNLPQAYAAYQDAWSPPVTSIDWPEFELASTVLEAWLGWTRVLRNTGRGEVYGVMEVAAERLVQRLAAAIHRR